MSTWVGVAPSHLLLRDPDYLTKQRAELKSRPFSFDTIGLSLLVIVMVCWEVMLSKGQEWDWLTEESAAADPPPARRQAHFLLQCMSPQLALRSYAENDAQRPLLEVRADSHVAAR